MTEIFEDVLGEIIEQLKPYSKETYIDQLRKKPKDKKNPEFYYGYKKTVEELMDNTVHSRARFPDELFENIAPNQSEDELEYIKQTYECVTRDVFLAMSNTVKRSLPNGQIEWVKSNESNNEIVDDVRRYLKEGIPKYRSLDEFSQILVDVKLEDANAVVSVQYDFEKYLSERLDENGETVIVLSDEQIKPKICIYHSDRVVHYSDDLCICLDYKKSLVTIGNQDVKKGHVFIGFTAESYYIAEQYGKYDEWNFEIKVVPHSIGYMPAERTKGIPVLYENNLIFSSPFNVSVPDLNLAVLDSANLLIIKRKVGYPTRVFLAQPCQHQMNGAICNDGRIKWSDGEHQHDVECPACKGAGLVSVFGPQSELMINTEKDAMDSTQIKANEAMAYVSPSVEIPKYLREEIDQFVLKAERNLHLKAEPRKAGNITATEKNQDAKNTEAFIKPISDQIWSLKAFVINTIGNLRYGRKAFEEVKPNVIAPSDFDLIKPEDYVAEIAEARKNGVPEIVIAQLMYNMFRSQSYSDSQSMKAFELIEQADRLLTLSNDQITTKLARNLAQPWEVTLHDSALFLIMQLLREDETFFEQEIEDQITQLQERAKAQTVTAQPPSLFPDVVEEI